MKYRTLALLRHGESKWNFENRFTGWTNVGLTENGKNEAKLAGKQLIDHDFKAEVIFSSVLKRSIDTAKICLKSMNCKNLIINSNWRLNERHYGSLQGLNKAETAKKYGDKQLLIWRRSYEIPPPKMELYDKNHPRHDKLYRSVDPKLLPSAESLKNTLDRVYPYWKKNIIPQLKIGKNTLIVAHGNSLRAIVKMLKNLSNEDIIKLNIPTGVPYLFIFSEDFKVYKDYYLGDREENLKKINNVANQSK